MNRDLFERTLAEFARGGERRSDFEDAVHYALFPGGKRIRPRVFIAACRDLAPEVSLTSAHLRIGAAIEMLHCATLVHDDLPALDNDEMRRGRPSLHIAYGEAIAVLVGDYLPLHALARLGEIAIPDQGRLLCELAEAYATVCHGQFLDLDEDERRRSLREIHLQKTGPLFRSALRCAAIMSGRGDCEVEAAGVFGERMGVYFQVADDFLDRYGDSAERGRERRSDQANSRVTEFGGDHIGDVAVLRRHTDELNERAAEFRERCSLSETAELDRLRAEIGAALNLR